MSLLMTKKGMWVYQMDWKLLSTVCKVSKICVAAQRWSRMFEAAWIRRSGGVWLVSRNPSNQLSLHLHSPKSVQQSVLSGSINTQCRGAAADMSATRLEEPESHFPALHTLWSVSLVFSGVWNLSCGLYQCFCWMYLNNKPVNWWLASFSFYTGKKNCYHGMTSSCHGDHSTLSMRGLFTPKRSILDSSGSQSTWLIESGREAGLFFQGISGKVMLCFECYCSSL